jgi:hypothetical protein
VDIPSFTENEGLFRAGAWDAMERDCRPTTRDWILCIDADEFLLAAASPDHDVHDLLHELVETATEPGPGVYGVELPPSSAVTFDVAEGYTVDAETGDLHVRTDGFWGQIDACRLVRWRPGATFAPRPEGGGSIPDGWGRGTAWTNGLAVVHLGHARPADRETRYRRYKVGKGHNPVHVESILTEPTLAPWHGSPLPEGAQP